MGILEILLEWHNNLPEVTPTMSLENQAKYLDKKYKSSFYSVPSRNSDGEETVETVPLIKFKDIVCKYRPHLQMGDYWLQVKIVNSLPVYKFFFITDELEETMIVNAVHPHLSHGVPCLGSFQGDINTAFAENNFIQFFALMKTYLSSYYGRSTYERGSVYGKVQLYPEMHDYQEIHEMFHTEGDDLDYYVIARDPMRWNWPKDMTAWSKIEISGQTIGVLQQYFKNTEYPWFKNVPKSNYSWSHGDRNSPINKILGYVYIAMQLGELTLYQAFEFVRIFLLSLEAQYSGNLSKELKDELELLSSDIANMHANGRFTANRRYSISLNTENRDEVAYLATLTRPYYRRSRDNTTEWLTQLKYAGHKVSNFMILLRKRRPDLATAKSYLKTTLDRIDVDDIKVRLNKVKKFGYQLALQQLDKDRRKFINEINRPEINNISSSDGQGSLFSENL